MKLQGKIAIVTGAGKGIGREAALAIAAEGATVAAVARTRSDLDETVRLIEDNGGLAVALSHDLTVGSEVEALAAEVMEKYGRIDILVNNAGGYPSEIYKNIEHQAIKLWEWSEDQWDQIIKTNLRIPFLCMNKILPVMIQQRSGKIVSVSSRMGRIASQMGAYAVAKGGIITMTKTAAIQAQEYGIQVNAVACGAIDTEMNQWMEDDDLLALIDEIPSGRLGKAEEVADLVYHLAYKSNYLTGQVIALDGGWI